MRSAGQPEQHAAIAASSASLEFVRAGADRAERPAATLVIAEAAGRTGEGPRPGCRCEQAIEGPLELHTFGLRQCCQQALHGVQPSCLQSIGTFRSFAGKGQRRCPPRSSSAHDEATSDQATHDTDRGWLRDPTDHGELSRRHWPVIV